MSVVRIKAVKQAARRMLNGLGIHVYGVDGEPIDSYTTFGIILNCLDVTEAKTGVSVEAEATLKAGQVYDLYTEVVEIRSRDTKDAILIPSVIEGKRQLFKSTDAPAVLGKGFKDRVRVRVVPLASVTVIDLLDSPIISATIIG